MVSLSCLSSPQLGAMISADLALLEACGGFIPDTGDLKTLLLHQQAKGLLGVKGILQYFVIGHKNKMAIIKYT